jgi:hypothetical protein
MLTLDEGFAYGFTPVVDPANGRPFGLFRIGRDFEEGYIEVWAGADLWVMTYIGSGFDRIDINWYEWSIEGNIEAGENIIEVQKQKALNVMKRGLYQYMAWKKVEEQIKEKSK